MQKVQYKNVARAKREQLLVELTESLNLDESNELLKYMAHVGILDELLEKELTELLRDDEQLRKDYIAVVNKIDKPTPTTILNILKPGTIYPYSERVLSKLYERKAYIQYIVSSTLKSGYFEVSEDKDKLWSSYIKILKSEGYTQTKKAMSKNNDFLQELNTNRNYIGLPPSGRIILSKIPQDKNCIEDIMTFEAYENDFIEQYLSQIVGFYDREAAVAFIENIILSDVLLQSKSIYEHTHSMLEDPALKSKYTRARNKLFE